MQAHKAHPELKHTAGKAYPLGASETENGVNFAVFSHHAKQVILCLFNDKGEQEVQIPLTHKTHGVWHTEVHGLSAGQHYGFRTQGDFAPDQQHFFNPSKLLIDPYAKQLSDKLYWHEDQSTIKHSGQINKQDSAHCVPKSIVSSKAVPAKHPLAQPVKAHNRSIYELHVKGFTQQLDIKPELKGSYLGLIEPQSLAHLKALGVTSLQILPCFSFASEMRLQALALKNFWGYNPINFFCPDFEYAIDDPVTEFKLMVEGLHKAGFEVILDVVYNHTAEGEKHHASVCYKGLDNATYYRAHANHYLNYTGCGNCFDSYQDASIQLIMDSMRYWLEIMGVDGFRFDLGVDLGRTQHDFDRNAPLLSAMLQDPVISQACLISEPWDIGPNGYQLGNFPAAFLECNDQYRDNIKRFWRGDSAQVQEFATRLMGSRDIFHKGHKSALQSVNYISYHDGFTLHDLVSYENRHNIANKENNRDGHGENISQNFGIEGETEDQSINLARLNQQECLLATLLLSQGTPHILGGDELSNSQQGNNNAYCQDNEIAWLDWQPSFKRSRLEKSISQLLALRKAYPILAECQLEDDDLYYHLEKDNVSWFNEQANPMSHDDWHQQDRDFLSVLLERQDKHQGKNGTTERLWLGFYRGQTPLSLPLLASNKKAELLFATQGVELTNGQLECAYASVFLISL